jgi:hypothetical protein
MIAESSSLLYQVACDFLMPGTQEPVELSPLGFAAIRDGINLADALGELRQSLDDLLQLSYELEGQGDSPKAAAAVRAAIAAEPSALAELGIERNLETLQSLHQRAKRIMRQRGPVSSTRTVADLRPPVRHR